MKHVVSIERGSSTQENLDTGIRIMPNIWSGSHFQGRFFTPVVLVLASNLFRCGTNGVVPLCRPRLQH